MLSPDGDGGGISRNIRLVCGLCIVAVAINPIIKIVDEVKMLDIEHIVEDSDIESDYQDKFNSSYAIAELENLKTGIRQMLSDKFGIDMSESEVSLSVTENEDGDRELTRIFITLYGSAIFKNTGEIEDHLEKIFGCETVTAIG